MNGGGIFAGIIAGIASLAGGIAGLALVVVGTAELGVASVLIFVPLVLLARLAIRKIQAWWYEPVPTSQLVAVTLTPQIPEKPRPSTSVKIIPPPSIYEDDDEDVPYEKTALDD